METTSTDPTLLMLIGGIVVLLAGSVAYGVYSTFGSGSKDLRDTIDEHAKMHELGIAHGHGGNSDAYEMSGKLQKDQISWKLNLYSIQFFEISFDLKVILLIYLLYLF